MKILIFGAGGMAGHVAYHWLRGKGYDVETHVRTPRDFDANYVADLYNNDDKLIEILTASNPDIVLSCIGILVNQSQRYPHIAAYINSYLPHRLAHLADERGFRLIHLSTDCVFSGTKGSYNEDAIKDEMKIYGLSKSLGEIANDRDCTIRMSIVGPELKPDGTGLFSWFMRQTEPILGYTNAFWNGITTLELARFIERIISENITGLVHVCSDRRLSKFELLGLFSQIYQYNIPISPLELDRTIDKSLAMTRQDINYQPREFEVLLRELKDWYSRTVPHG